MIVGGKTRILITYDKLNKHMKALNKFYIILVVLCFTDLILMFFYKSASAFNIFIVLLISLSLNFYRDHISELRAKVSKVTLRKKRIKTIILMFLITWGIFLALQLNNNSISFSDERWVKTILLSLMITILVILIPVIYVEYNFQKKE